MRTMRCHVAVLLCMLWGNSALADDAKPRNFALFRVTTDFQRDRVGSRIDAYAELDIAAAVHDGQTDLQRLDLNAFRQRLSKLADEIKSGEPSLLVYLRYADVSVSNQDRKRLESNVMTICRDAGFKKVRAGAKFEGGSWQDKMAQFADIIDEEDASEAPIENEFVRIYPVRTHFSRFLQGSPNVDCSVDIRRPIDGRFEKFSEADQQTIRECIAQLGLKQTRTISFSLLATTSGQKRAEEYFASWPSHSAIEPFIQQLGFKRSTYGMTTMRVSPEDLLGKPAPDFTLEVLSGGKFHLQDEIRGRVAVISFWGVDCGACRVEAPYLTALQQKFAEQGVVVVAINGYNESKSKVEQFARDTKLSHAIVLHGRDVAEQKYTVVSYPVTFLVDKSGAIVDYHLGFEVGDEQPLAEKISRLIAETPSEDAAQ